MKIKAIGSSAQNRGTPIEFTAQEKPAVAVKMAVAEASPVGQVWWSEGVTVDDLQYSARGNPGAKYADNRYVARGTVMVRKTITTEKLVNGNKVLDEQLLPAKKMAYHVEFDDSLDRLGMPDLQITKFNLE